MDYLDFGSSSDSDDGGDLGMACEMDSDEEEQYENRRLMKMFNLHEPPSKSQRSIQDFEAEMEAELDRRALEIEAQGGMEHQKSISRSSSTTSLNKSPRASPVPGCSAIVKKSCVKRPHSSAGEGDSGPKANKSVRFAESTISSPAASTSTEQAVEGQSMAVATIEDKKAKDMYDELYFDSDESDGEDEGKRIQKENSRRFMTNDELFYDPMSDDKDQAWIDKQRKKSYGEGSNSSQAQATSNACSQDTNSTSKQVSDPPKKIVPQSTNTASDKKATLPKTDAVLNCPACFTTVCQDCQRHELYVGQYRAMFVVNCMVNTQETLSVPEKPPKKFRKNKSKNTNANEPPTFTPTSSSDVFHPVMCKICRTQVAMYDSEEIYHFFNVLASQP